MINKILDEMIKRGFVDEYGDIYCKAVVVLDADSYDNALLTFEHC